MTVGSVVTGDPLVVSATSFTRFYFLAFFLSFLAFFATRISSVSPPSFVGGGGRRVNTSLR